MNKAYVRINGGKGWEDYTSVETPLNAYNLNHMEVGIDTVDTRVVTLEETKATKIEVSTLFDNVSFDKRTGILTFTRKNGATVVIDTPMEKIQTGIYYDPVTETLMLPLIDGTQIQVDLSRLITENEFLDSDTIYFSIGLKEEKAFEKRWINQEMGFLTSTPKLHDFLIIESDVEISYISGTYKKDEESEYTPVVFTPNSSNPKHVFFANFPGGAVSYIITAETEEFNLIQTEECMLRGYYSKSGTIKADIKLGSIQEKHLRPDYLADIKAEVAKAETSSENSEAFAKQSQSYAVGGTDTRTGEDTDNSKYYYQQSKSIYDNFSQAGTVTGVKGNAESTYQTGNVNLTAENIGAVNKNGDTIPGRLYFSGYGEIKFITPDVAGGHARGMNFLDKNGTDTWGGIGVYGSAGILQGIYIGAGTAYPWDSSYGLRISDTYIKWKNSNLVTENSGIAKEATKATQDGNGNVIANTYARKEWVYLGNAGKGGGSFLYDVILNGGKEFLLVIYIAPINDDIGFFETHYIPYDVFTETAAHTNGIVDYSIEIDNENVSSGSKVNVSFNRGGFLFTNNTGNCDMKVYVKK